MINLRYKTVKFRLSDRYKDDPIVIDLLLSFILTIGVRSKILSLDRFKSKWTRAYSIKREHFD